MTALREAAQQMLEEAEANKYAVSNQAPHSDVMSYNAAILKLRAALIREEKAAAWLAERKDHWRKEREKAHAAKDQDPELSAALGWPGGISDPVLDRKTLLQMVAALRLASRQALEAICGAKLCEVNSMSSRYEMVRLMDEAITALRAALAQKEEPVQVAERERIASQWDGCVTRSLDTFGPVDIGASIRAGELVEAQQAEPVEPVGEVLHDWSTEKECIAGTWAHLNVLGKNLPVGTKLYTAPPQRTYLVKSAQEQEREECAQIADAEASIEGIAQRIAAAIRARGNT